MRRWYVAHTHPHKEHRAVSHLQRQQFETFLPCFKKRRSHARRIDQVLSPLFPRYLFVSLDLEADRWRAVHSTVGVRHLVCHGDLPAAVPTGIIEDLMAQADRRGVVAPATLLLFERGDRVRIVDGAFADQVGQYDRMTADQRIVLLLDILGREIEATVPISAVDAA